MLLSDVLETPLLATRESSMARRRRREKAGSSAELSPLSIVELAEAARAQCEAQSAGISLFRRADPIASEWITVTGALSDFKGSRFPLRHSLCGVTADYHSTQLFIKPHRYFKWMDHAGVFISEALVTPLFDAGGHCFGTVWAMSHRGARPNFDEGDAHALEAIAVAVSLILLPASASSEAVFHKRSSDSGPNSRSDTAGSTRLSRQISKGLGAKPG